MNRPLGRFSLQVAMFMENCCVLPSPPLFFVYVCLSVFVSFCLFFGCFCLFFSVSVSFRPFLFVFAIYCPFLSISVRFCWSLLVIVYFYPFMFVFLVFVPFSSVLVCFYLFLSVSERFCLFEEKNCIIPHNCFNQLPLLQVPGEPRFVHRIYQGKSPQLELQAGLQCKSWKIYTQSK